MKLAPFPNYRSCNLDWAETIPTHWREGKLRWLSTRFAGGTPDRANEAYWNDGTIPWLASGAVNQFDITEPSEYISEEGFKNSSARWVPRGGLVVALAGQGKTKGMVAQLQIEATCNQSMAAIIPQESLTNRFLLYWLSSNYQNIRNLAGGDLRDGLNLDLLGSISCPIPPIDEQRKISKFLDRETAKIDSLVAEQEKLIELLKEKRQAVISHAVTKGLDPKAPMKESGIEWLGDIPEHWSVKKLKRVSPQLTVGIVVNPSEYVAEVGLPFIYGGDISEGNIDTENCRRISSEDSCRNEKTKLQQGDIVTVRVGAPGVSAVVPAECDGGNCASVMLIRKGDFDSDWLCFAMNSRIVRYQVEIVQYGAAQEQFNIGHAVDFWIPTPPISEQALISRYLNESISAFERLTTIARNSIDLLRERRSALISAAVTGKIDVRGFVDTEAA